MKIFYSYEILLYKNNQGMTSADSEQSKESCTTCWCQKVTAVPLFNISLPLSSRCKYSCQQTSWCSSGVVGKAKQFNCPCLSVVVIFALLVVAGVGQQGSLWVPGDCERWGIALNLPQLLTCNVKKPTGLLPNILSSKINFIYFLQHPDII